ncbi:unnamed protein product [Caretta caretta]
MPRVSQDLPVVLVPPCDVYKMGVDATLGNVPQILITLDAAVLGAFAVGGIKSVRWHHLSMQDLWETMSCF